MFFGPFSVRPWRINWHRRCVNASSTYLVEWEPVTTWTTSATYWTPPYQRWLMILNLILSFWKLSLRSLMIASTTIAAWLPPGSLLAVAHRAAPTPQSVWAVPLSGAHHQPACVGQVPVQLTGIPTENETPSPLSHTSNSICQTDHTARGSSARVAVYRYPYLRLANQYSVCSTHLAWLMLLITVLGNDFWWNTLTNRGIWKFIDTYIYIVMCG